MWTRLANRLRYLVGGSRIDRDLAQELDFHRDMLTADEERRGYSHEAATLTARRKMGNTTLMMEHSRDAWIVRWVDELMRDLRYAFRGFARSPAFTLVALLTLALGIGANAAIFSLVNATLFRRLPVRDPGRLFYVGGVLSYPVYAELRDHNDVLDGLIAWGPITASLNTDGGNTELVGGAIVTGNYFDALGLYAVQGRTLTLTDDIRPGGHPVAVISHRLWERRFDGRLNIVGREVSLNGHTFTIVGVIPKGFGGLQLGVPSDVYVPMMMQAVMRPPSRSYSGEQNPDLLTKRESAWLSALGQVKRGITRAQAESSLSGLVTAMTRAIEPNTPLRAMTLTPINDGAPGQRAQLIPIAGLLMSVVGAVLLIACANLANLLLSRATARRREIAVRLAIGASRGRLTRQLLTESVLLAVIGGGMGLALAALVVRGFPILPTMPGELPLALDVPLDARVLVFAFSLSLLTGIVFGLAPALRASRPNLVVGLKDESFVSNERMRRFSFRNTLVVAEVALSVLLLIVTGLFVRSLRQAQAIDPGFDAERLLSTPLNINLLRYTKAQGREVYTRAVDFMEALPGVESASVARIAAVSGSHRGLSLRVEGRASNSGPLSQERGVTPAGPESVSANVIGPGFFQTLGIPLLKGRDFSERDSDDRPQVIIVNESLARRLFSGEDPLGRRVSFSGEQGPWCEIVGVVRDSKYAALVEAPTPVVYLPLAQNHETGMTLYVRTSGDPANLVASVRRSLQSLEPNLPVTSISPVMATLSASLYPARMGAVLLMIFGGLALLLAAVGVYGVMAFSVSRRTRELGIRQALGADTRNVFQLVIGEGMSLVAIGIALGLAGAAFGTRLLTSFLYGTSTLDIATFVTVPSILGAVALVACIVPARRAVKVDPMVALRFE